MIERLQALLVGELPPGVYRLNSRTATRDIERIATEAGWEFYLLDLRNVRNKATLMATAAEALRFPSYFGGNWDAFEEVLNDMPWDRRVDKPGAPVAELPARGHLTLLDRSSPLRYASPADLRTALEIFQSAVAARQPGDAPLAVLVRGAGPLADELPLLA